MDDFISDPRMRGTLLTGSEGAGADIGPLSFLGARDEIVDRLEKSSNSDGARISAGGKKSDRAGGFMKPALLPLQMSDASDAFSPVVIVYGLSSFTWGSELEQVQKAAEKLDDGMSLSMSTCTACVIKKVQARHLSTFRPPHYDRS